MADKGAHFYRCDFQVHSPRDGNWTGADCITDDERRAYAEKLVGACRQRGLHAIAVTDHHDMLFASYVRRAAEDEKDANGQLLPKEERLIVFPGMELTLGVPCQALLIFDASFPDDLFQLATPALASTPSAATEAKTAPVQRLNHIQSLKQLKEELDKHTFLRDRYIVFPNVTNEGQFSIFRTGLAGKYIEMPWVGGYIDGAFDNLDAGIKNRIAGKDKNWGSKRIACFQTSDSRREDHEELGKHSTWVKWAVPSAEALRQACLAQESRVSQLQPLLPAVGVEAISISNSSFLGPIELELNPQYTALIGGRGTGKSTLLEYLRWALCDQPPGIGDEETPNYQARRARLIDQTLKPLSATVQVRFQVNGVVHLVRRSSVDGSLQIKIGADAMRPCSEDEVRSLLPIQAYSQKQLSDVSVRVEELNRFISAPIRNDLARIDREEKDRAGRVRQAHATRQRQRALTRMLKKRELEERSLAEQAQKLRDGLTGLSAEDRATIDRGKLFDDAGRAVHSWKAGVSAVRDGATSLSQLAQSHLDTLPTVRPGLEEEVLTRAFEESRAFLTDAKAAFDALVSRAERIIGDHTQLEATNPWRVWAERLQAAKATYDEAVARSSAHSERMKQLRDIEEQISKSATETARINEELRSLATAEAAYETERSAWLALLDERDDLLEAQCLALTQASGGAIRAQVRRRSDVSNFVAQLRTALSGSRVRNIDAIGESITAAQDPGAQWRAILSDLEKLADFDPQIEGAERRPDAPVLSAAGLSSSELDRITQKLTSEEWLGLSLIPVASSPVFEYRAREADYIPFRNASAGQQATALLKTLLNQSGPPLIIDQPEEDLDNPVILEIVEQVWTAKQKRQLIFASHNANLVVNGDAELVAWCDYRAAGDQSRGMIAGEGAIDVPEVRDAIKRIMEGGAAAFNLRKEKYGF